MNRWKLPRWLAWRLYWLRNDSCARQGRHGGLHDPCARGEGCACHYRIPAAQ